MQSEIIHLTDTQVLRNTEHYQSINQSFRRFFNIRIHADFRPMAAERQKISQHQKLCLLGSKLCLDRTKEDFVKSWKPCTLGFPVLGSLIAFSLFLIIILEILFHISSKSGSGGGLAFALSVDSLPGTVAFRYIPEILWLSPSTDNSQLPLFPHYLGRWLQHNLEVISLQWPFQSFLMHYTVGSTLMRSGWSLGSNFRMRVAPLLKIRYYFNIHLTSYLSFLSERYVESESQGHIPILHDLPSTSHNSS